LSPDGKRLAVAMRSGPAQQIDLWVFDLSTGESIQITSDSAAEAGLAWSPDSSQIAYAASIGYGLVGLYRKDANGTGRADLVYRHAAHPNDSDNFVAFLSDWSADGRYLTFYDNRGRVYALPLDPIGSARTEPVERKPVEIATQYRAGAGYLSPDSRFVAYSSLQSGRWEVYVRPFEPSATDGAAPIAEPLQVSNQGSCTCRWDQDGKAFYYLTLDGAMMAVDVSTASGFRSAKPRLLFRVPNSDTVDPISATSISRDGQQFLFAVPVTKRRGTAFPRQTMVFDRRGKLFRKLGEPRYTEPRISPDGTKVAAFLNINTLWVFDVSTGKGVQIKTSVHEVQYEISPVWSPDNSQIAFFSFRESMGGIYRIAANGTGKEELVFKHAPGVYAPPITDWSPDGRFLTYSEAGAPSWLGLNGERKAMELLRAEYNIYGVRFSPDSRFVAYVSDESGRNEVYVRPFEQSSGLGDMKWQVSTEGGLGLIQWRRDGKEMYYLAPDGGVMAVDVTTVPSFHAGSPKTLFRVPPAFPLVGVFEREGTNAPECSNNGLPNCEQGSISRSGERFVFNVPLPPDRKAITIPPAILAKYVGTYSESSGIEWTVTLEGGQLLIQRTGRQKVPLFPESETTFFLKIVNGDFEFVKDDGGKVICIFLYRGGAPIQLVRQ
jgi:Tol biopolymer transport system component